MRKNRLPLRKMTLVTFIWITVIGGFFVLASPTAYAASSNPTFTMKTQIRQYMSNTSRAVPPDWTTISCADPRAVIYIEFWDGSFNCYEDNSGSSTFITGVTYISNIGSRSYLITYVYPLLPSVNYLVLNPGQDAGFAIPGVEITNIL